MILNVLEKLKKKMGKLVKDLWLLEGMLELLEPLILLEVVENFC